tara:strand:- start:1281 stop:1478 length:198 start_codon:yes stop_codon:yes gene_type:complete
LNPFARKMLLERYGFIPTPVNWQVRNKIFGHLKLKAEHEGQPFNEEKAWEIATQKMVEAAKGATI